MPTSSNVVDVTFRALADPTRRAVVAQLSVGPASVSELAAPFDMSMPSFVQHLRVLEACGVVRSIKRGRVRTCRLEPAPLLAVEDWLATQRTTWEERADRFQAYVEGLDEATA